MATTATIEAVIPSDFCDLFWFQYPIEREMDLALFLLNFRFAFFPVSYVNANVKTAATPRIRGMDNSFNDKSYHNYKTTLLRIG